MLRSTKQGVLVLGLLVLACFIVQLPMTKRLHRAWNPWRMEVVPGALNQTLKTTASSREVLPQQLKGSQLLCHTFGCGRLGNTLFEYASILGIGTSTNRTPVFMNGGQLRGVLKHFPHPSPDDAEKRQRCRKARVVNEGKGGQYNRHLVNLQPGVDYNVGRCLQSWMYFADLRDDILKAVTFSDVIIQNASDVINGLRTLHPHSTFVGIHIRRGDMASKKYLSYGYRLASPEFFQKAMTYFRQKFARVVFLVASVDYDWSVKNIVPVNGDVVFLSPTSAEVDMQILSMTDHMIITIGTFGWWAAYKIPGKPTVIFLKNIAKENSRHSSWYTPGLPDLMLPGWIGM